MPSNFGYIVKLNQLPTILLCSFFFFALLCLVFFGGGGCCCFWGGGVFVSFSYILWEGWSEFDKTPKGNLIDCFFRAFFS